MGASSLPVGARLRALIAHRDERGDFTEVFRAAWETGAAPVQWAFQTTAAGVLRGVHVHIRHVDYFIVASGRASIGLRDLRPGSPSDGRAALVELRGDAPAALTIPTGVAHGLFFHEPSVLIHAASEYYDPSDDIACRWDDPGLAIPWPVTSARLSERDAAAPPLGDIAGLIPPFRDSA